MFDAWDLFPKSRNGPLSFDLFSALPTRAQARCVVPVRRRGGGGTSVLGGYISSMDPIPRRSREKYSFIRHLCIRLECRADYRSP